MTTMASFAWWEIFFAGVSTIAIYSFLYKENSFYRFFEHFYIGLGASLMIVYTIKDLLWPLVLKPLFGLDRILFPDGTYNQPYNTNVLLFLIPMSFGSLYYFILSRRFNWLAQLAIGFGLGCSAGMAFLGTFNELMPQIYDSFRPLYDPNSWQDTLSNLIFFVTLIGTFFFFFFTFERKPRGVTEQLSGIGRWMMMVCFGAFFGSTIMARMALLVERLQFMIEQWVPAVLGA